MPTAVPYDLSPYINLNPDSYLPPSAYGGSVLTEDQKRARMQLMDSMYGGLVGAPANTPTPYIKDGMYYFTNPNKKNPVPLASVPGARLKPSSTYLKSADQTQAILDQLPYLNQAALDTMMPAALTQLGVQQATAGPQAQLMLDLYNKYGPALNAVGNEIIRRNALAQAETDKQVVTGPGRELVQAALETAKLYDPEYFALRAAGAGKATDLMNSYDLSGNLTPNIRDEIAKGLVREGEQRGTANAPSNVDIVGNAMKYGQAGEARKQQQQTGLSDAIKTAASFIPYTKSGTDVFQVATGKPSQPNPGAAQFTGLPNANANNAYGLAGQMFGDQTSMTNTQTMADLQRDLAKKDWLDQFQQFTSGLSNITSMAGNLATLCWVAREVFGKNNPKWKMFRSWLIEDAPIWFFKLYHRYGKRFATFIHNKPLIKSVLKVWMETKIYGHQTNLPANYYNSESNL